MEGLRFLRCADSGLLVEVEEPADVVSLYDALREQLPEGVDDLVPARRTVLLKLSHASADVDRIARHVTGLTLRDRPVVVGDVVEVPVCYDGPDLTSVCDSTGLTIDDLVARHTAGLWTVAFCGFSPGFAYLIGGDPALRVPRLDQPRTRVPAGSVGLAGEFTGIYPRESPGGWRLIGRTDLQLWSLDRDPPAQLTPGTQVRFRAT